MMEETNQILETSEPVEETKPAQNEEKRPWRRSEKYIRRGTLVTCSICHSARGTFRKNPINGKLLCEACYAYAMMKKK